ncbi:hypothetical protein DES53_11755 [Roseimicrobium gellanilyticum]|uniref:Uncharacterized protein n=1 Tax=Roseimicrobium gellanilyticum TaxID=748857 RepID=A0A366H607_9BACT|nr:hypothetical protein DES53_11755 [Roseimicrobium gellanilyticum]
MTGNAGWLLKTSRERLNGGSKILLQPEMKTGACSSRYGHQ